MKNVLLFLLGSVVVLSIIALILGASLTSCVVGAIVAAAMVGIGYIFTKEVPRCDWSKHLHGLENEAVVPIGAIVITIAGVLLAWIMGSSFPSLGHWANCAVIGMWAGIMLAPNATSRRIPDRCSKHSVRPVAPGSRGRARR
jgi:hypothetical protein